MNGGLYEAMRKELRYAVEEIRTELNQVDRNKSVCSNYYEFYFWMVNMLVKNGSFYLLNCLFCVQAMGRNQTALASGDCLPSENSKALQDFSRIREKYAQKLEQVLFCLLGCISPSSHVPVR